ncbi:MAG: hypothetical protein NWP90_08685, partial [Flavobacterium sp.]|nr:hypothetical protein [Flavobacterium sp.]
LQERTANFAAFYDKINSYDALLQKLHADLQPLEHNFIVVTI